MSEPQAQPALSSVKFVYQQRYPASLVDRIVECGAELPTTLCPPWWRPFARRRWIRDMNGRIALARMYGWRTNRGPARHHLMMRKWDGPEPSP